MSKKGHPHEHHAQHAHNTHHASHAHNSANSPQQTSAPQGASLEHHILQNLVELQKVHVNLAEKFDKLSKNMGDLLTLFELAARNFAKSPANQGIEKDKEFLDKIDRLLDQNKTIAKGLTLMEEKIRERTYGPGSGMARPAPSIEGQQTPSTTGTGRPLPRF